MYRSNKAILFRYKVIMRYFFEKKSSFILVLFLCLVIFTFCTNAKEIVKIGCIAPLTGANADVGIGLKNCVELAINQANASGEYNYEIRLAVEDDAADPATGVAAALKLCSDPEVIGIVSHFNSTVALATVHTTNRFGVIQIMPGTIHPDITRGNDYKNVFRVNPDNLTEQYFGQALVVDKLGTVKWVSLHSTDSYGEGCNDNFKQVLKEKGGTLLSEDGYTKGTRDFRPILNRVKELEPEGIYFGDVSPEPGLCKRQMSELGMSDVIFYGCTGMVSETFNEIAGDAAEGTYGVGYLPLDEDSAFVKAYNATYNEPWEVTGTYAYDATGIILKALKEVGKDRNDIVEYVASPTFQYDGILGTTRFDEYGQTMSGGLDMKISHNGEWVSLASLE